jgi:hypothetical protein
MTIERLRVVLWCVLLASLICLVVQVILYLRDARLAAQALPAAISREIATTRTDLLREIAGVRADLVGQVAGARQDAGRQLDALRAQVMARVDQAGAAADRRMGDTLGRVDAALVEVHGLRQDLQPVLANAASLEADAQASWDDLYPDVRGTVASVTVAATSTAQTAQVVRDASKQVGASAVAVADDVRREVDAATKPKHWYERMLGPAYTIARVLGVFL